MSIAALERAAIRQACALREELTVTEWADRYRKLPETSTAPGPFQSAVIPYARRPMDLTADPSVRLIVLCWASQTCKSTVLENAIGYRIDRMPTPIVFVRPKIDDAEGWVKERFLPMVRATPVLAARVRLGRTTDSTLRFKRFPGGFLFVASAGSATELASRSSPFVPLDEVDRMEVIPGEGNPVEIVMRRMGATDVSTAMMTSSPRHAETTIIWPYLEAGTYETYHVPCPHCGHAQALVFGGPNEGRGLKWPVGKPHLAEYLCEACAALIPNRAKVGMLAAGTWVPSNPDGSYPSFHLNGLYSPFGGSSWGVLAEEWTRAQGKSADLQVFVNTRLAELWQESADLLESDAITARLEPLAENVVPEGVGLLTAFVDVQEAPGRCEVHVWGWGAGLESWLVAIHIVPGDPQKERSAPGSPWAEVDRILATPVPHASGAPMPIAATFIDSGFATTQVYRFTRRLAGRKIFAAKGQGGEGVPLVSKPTLQTKERVLLFMVGVDKAKTEFLRSQIMESTPGPGYVHFPDWLSTDQCQQFVAEKRRRRVHRGRVIYEWVRKRDDMPNEALDGRVGARAALEMLGTRTIEKLGELAAKAAAPVAGAPADGAAKSAKRSAPKKGGWINSWRRGM